MANMNFLAGKRVQKMLSLFGCLFGMLGLSLSIVSLVFSKVKFWIIILMTVICSMTIFLQTLAALIKFSRNRTGNVGELLVLHSHRQLCLKSHFAKQDRSLLELGCLISVTYWKGYICLSISARSIISLEKDWLCASMCSSLHSAFAQQQQDLFKQNGLHGFSKGNPKFNYWCHVSSKSQEQRRAHKKQNRSFLPICDWTALSGKVQHPLIAFSMCVT